MYVMWGVLYILFSHEAFCSVSGFRRLGRRAVTLDRPLSEYLKSFDMIDTISIFGLKPTFFFEVCSCMYPIVD